MADFCRYYKLFGKEFLLEWYRSWRLEVFSTLGIALIIFALVHKEDASAMHTLLVTAEACGLWLIAFGAYHLIRTPWRLDREVRAQLQRQASQKEVKCQIELLTQLVDRGQEFIRRCRCDPNLVPDGEVETWLAEVVTSVQETFDITYVSRLGSSVGMPLGAAYWPNLNNRHVDGLVNVRVYRLQQFIDELREHLKEMRK
jgi:hypothetical protein